MNLMIIGGAVIVFIICMLCCSFFVMKSGSSSSSSAAAPAAAATVAAATVSGTTSAAAVSGTTSDAVANRNENPVSGSTYGGYYDGYVDLVSIAGGIGSDPRNCRNISERINETNLENPIVGYGIRNDKNGNAIYNNTCILYKRNETTAGQKRDNTTGENDAKVVSRCLDSRDDPNNKCANSRGTSNPSSIVLPQVSGSTYGGYFSPLIDLHRIGGIGSDPRNCRYVAQAFNETNPANPVIGYGIRSNNEGDPGLRNTCIFYKKNETTGATKVDAQASNLLISRCLDTNKDPNNKCQ